MGNHDFVGFVFGVVKKYLLVSRGGNEKVKFNRDRRAVIAAIIVVLPPTSDYNPGQSELCLK